MNRIWKSKQTYIRYTKLTNKFSITSVRQKLYNNPRKGFYESDINKWIKTRQQIYYGSLKTTIPFRWATKPDPMNSMLPSSTGA